MVDLTVETTDHRCATSLVSNAPNKLSAIVFKMPSMIDLDQNSGPELVFDAAAITATVLRQ